METLVEDYNGQICLTNPQLGQLLNWMIRYSVSIIDIAARLDRGEATIESLMAQVSK